MHLDLPAWLDRQWLGNPASAWMYAVGLFLAAWIGLRSAVALLRRALPRWVARTETRLDDVVAESLRATRSFFYVAVGLWAGARVLELPGAADRVLRGIAVVAVIAQGALWAMQFISLWAEGVRDRRRATDPAAATTVAALGFVGKLVVVSGALLLALANLGVDITALVAGLGVGGVAVALAAQNVLGDLFASLAIVFDKPFVLGDFITVGELRGTVEQVGLKTTRVRSLDGEQIVFSNNDLLASRVRNFGRLSERRVAFTLGVTYQTPRGRLERIPALVRAAIEAQPDVRFDRAHFVSYGDFALLFEVVYFVLSPDFNRYRDLHQAVLLRIHRDFERDGIEFAYPTQTILLQPQPPGGTPGTAGGGA